MSEHDPKIDLAKKNARMGMSVFLVVLVMLGLAFASVPLYDLFCRVTGFDGTTQVSEALPDTVLDRQVVIKFNADTHKSLPWDFKPEMREISVKLGQKGLTAYHAKNNSDQTVVGSAVYNVTPFKAGKYFHKIECFCFGEQSLQAGEDVSMPVLFYVDPSMAEDPHMDDVKVITLSYNFYKSETKELDEALEAFYNAE
ncbi:MAG: cytochrome c oxidase assembly protein [Alphaproteobacteria bacterium]|nr:cytochrome c oxidase assembly protein [Alphaproteobacteria bacterium]HCQ70955.1 cytochrome c oxidase assembly protein [Rhodospirillaceae bacterium]|tara:strand:- start:85059 stop:85652 length:594 start_codon:yes stop_codon:yes gene_type:complete